MSEVIRTNDGRYFEIFESEDKFYIREVEPHHSHSGYVAIGNGEPCGGPYEDEDEAREEIDIRGDGEYDERQQEDDEFAARLDRAQDE